MDLHGLLAGIGTGLAGGFTSGLLGVSPGGGLVVFSVLLLGAEQHVAQGLSLMAQIPPTSLAGIRHYRESGSRSPLRWLIVLTIGFVAGGIIGAYAASFASRTVLQWTYVAYLVLLDVMLLLRRERKETEEVQGPAAHDLHWAALSIVGLAAGGSSGFLGIGGGLATVVGLSAILRVPQHQAQMISLVLSLVPTTIPLLAAGMVLVVVGAGRRHWRPDRGQRHGGPPRQPSGSLRTAFDDDRLRLGNGALHGLQGAELIRLMPTRHAHPPARAAAAVQRRRSRAR